MWFQQKAKYFFISSDSLFPTGIVGGVLIAHPHMEASGSVASLLVKSGGGLKIIQDAFYFWS